MEQLTHPSGVSGSQTLLSRGAWPPAHESRRSGCLATGAGLGTEHSVPDAALRRAVRALGSPCCPEPCPRGPQRALGRRAPSRASGRRSFFRRAGLPPPRINMCFSPLANRKRTVECSRTEGRLRGRRAATGGAGAGAEPRERGGPGPPTLGQGGVSHQGPPTGSASVGRSRAPVPAWCLPFKLVFSRPSSCPSRRLFHTTQDSPMLDPGGPAVSGSPHDTPEGFPAGVCLPGVIVS